MLEKYIYESTYVHILTIDRLYRYTHVQYHQETLCIYVIGYIFSITHHIFSIDFPLTAYDGLCSVNPHFVSMV